MIFKRATSLQISSSSPASPRLPLRRLQPQTLPGVYSETCEQHPRHRDPDRPHVLPWRPRRQVHGEPQNPPILPTSAKGVRDGSQAAPKGPNPNPEVPNLCTQARTLFAGDFILGRRREPLHCAAFPGCGDSAGSVHCSGANERAPVAPWGAKQRRANAAFPVTLLSARAQAGAAGHDTACEGAG